MLHKALFTLLKNNYLNFIHLLILYTKFKAIRFADKMPIFGIKH